MAYIPETNSVVAFQSDPTKLVGTVSVVGVLSPSSVMVLNPVSVLTVNPNPASVLVVNPVSILSVTQGSTPWVVNQPSPSVIAYQLAGSILATSATFTPPANQSVSGTVHVDNFSSVVTYQAAGSVMAVSGSFTTGNSSVLVLNPVSILAVTQGTDPWKINVPSPSVIAYQLAGSVLQVTGGGGGTQYAENTQVASVTGTAVMFKSNMTTSILSVVTPNTPLPIYGSASVTGTMSVLGTVPVTQSGVWMTSVVNTNPSSLLVGASIIGLTPVAPTPSSVMTIQGTSPWVVGSVAANLQSSNASVLVISQVTRNDTLASILGADFTQRDTMGDSQGRTIIKPFAPEDATIISYVGSVVSTSVTLIQASVTGKRNYITDFWIANTGSVATLVTFQGGDTSIVGFTIAPATGGSNSPGIAIPLKTTPSQDLAFKVGTASSVLYVTLKGYQAQ